MGKILYRSEPTRLWLGDQNHDPVIVDEATVLLPASNWDDLEENGRLYKIEAR
jgi:hypothetical protein